MLSRLNSKVKVVCGGEGVASDLTSEEPEGGKVRFASGDGAPARSSTGGLSGGVEQCDGEPRGVPENQRERGEAVGECQRGQATGMGVKRWAHPMGRKLGERRVGKGRVSEGEEWLSLGALKR